jgi:hypothetical protein
VISVASTLPHEQELTVTRWTLDALVATVRDAVHTDALSRSSLWRMLHAVALKPHQSASWLNSHDADFATTAQAMCQLYVTALEAYE